MPIRLRFTLPADAQTLLDNLADGDRWILKLARSAAVTPTDQVITAEGRHGTRSKTTVSEEVPIQQVSFFDSSVAGDYDDPEVSDSTPGCVLTFTPTQNSNAPILGSSAARRPPRRIPPSYVTGAVDAFWATVQMQAAVLILRTSISQTSSGSSSGPNLTDAGRTTLGIALRADDGTTISFLVSALDDTTEPYQRNLDNTSGSDPAFSSAPVSTFSGAEYTACRAAFLAGGGTVVIVDTAHANVDWPNLEFVSADPSTATDQTVTAEGRHATRGEVAITEEAVTPTPGTDQPVTAEGRHGTRGEATVSEETPTPITPNTWFGFDGTSAAGGRTFGLAPFFVVERGPTVDAGAVTGVGALSTAEVVHVDIKPVPEPLDSRFPTIDLPAHESLLIPQYDGATKFHALVRGIVAVMQGQVVDPLLDMSRGLNHVESEGVLLDWLGGRMGIMRPSVPSSDFTKFGFDGTLAAGGRTFGQAPFFTVARGIESVEPIGDVIYRRLLAARARRLRGGADRETIEAVLAVIWPDGDGYVDESVSARDAAGDGGRRYGVGAGERSPVRDADPAPGRDGDDDGEELMKGYNPPPVAHLANRPAPTATIPRPADLCSVQGCDRTLRSRGMCDMHATRWRRHGDASVVMKGGRRGA